MASLIESKTPRTFHEIDIEEIKWFNKKFSEERTSIDELTSIEERSSDEAIICDTIIPLTDEGKTVNSKVLSISSHFGNCGGICWGVLIPDDFEPPITEKTLMTLAEYPIMLTFRSNCVRSGERLVSVLPLKKENFRIMTILDNVSKKITKRMWVKFDLPVIHDLTLFWSRTMSLETSFQSVTVKEFVGSWVPTSIRRMLSEEYIKKNIKMFTEENIKQLPDGSKRKEVFYANDYQCCRDYVDFE